MARPPSAPNIRISDSTGLADKLANRAVKKHSCCSLFISDIILVGSHGSGNLTNVMEPMIVVQGEIYTRT